MGVIIRQSLKSSSIMYLGALIGVFNRLFLFPKFLSPDQIGLIDLLLIVSLFFSSISSLGVIGSLVKYYNIHKEKNKLDSFIGFLLLIGFAGFVLVSFFLVLFKPHFISYYSKDSIMISEYYYFIIPLTLIFIIKGFFANYSLTNQRATVPSILGDFLPKLGIGLLVILLGLSLLTFNSLINNLVFIYATLNIVLIVYCLQQFKLKVKINFKSILKEEKQDIAKYSFFVLLSGMSGYIAQFIDTAMVGSMKGLEWAGVYSIAFFLGLSIEMPKRAISSISLPIIVKHFDSKEYKEIDKLYKQSSINQGIIGGLFLLLIFVNINEIFQLIPNSEKYEIGKNVALIIGFSRWLDMITGINSEILRSSKYYFWDLITVAFFITISIIANTFLIPIYGLNGAALASLVSIVFYNLVRIVVLKKLYGFQPFTLKSIWLSLILLLLALSYFVLPSFNTSSVLTALLAIGTKTAVYSSLFVFVCYKMKLSTEVNTILQKVLFKAK